MKNKSHSPKLKRYITWRLAFFLLFVTSLFFIGLEIKFPSNLHPAAFWFNTYADSLHAGDNFWIKFILNEPTIESRLTNFSHQYQYQLYKSIQYGFVDGKNNLVPPKSICIDKLIISEYIEFGKDILEGHEPICSIVNRNERGFFTTMLDIETAPNQEISYDVNLNFNSFYYPFIKSTNLMILQIEYHTVDEKNQSSSQYLRQS